MPTQILTTHLTLRKVRLLLSSCYFNPGNTTSEKLHKYLGRNSPSTDSNCSSQQRTRPELPAACSCGCCAGPQSAAPPALYPTGLTRPAAVATATARGGWPKSWTLPRDASPAPAGRRASSLEAHLLGRPLEASPAASSAGLGSGT